MFGSLPAFKFFFIAALWVSKLLTINLILYYDLDFRGFSFTYLSKYFFIKRVYTLFSLISIKIILFLHFCFAIFKNLDWMI